MGVRYQGRSEQDDRQNRKRGYIGKNVAPLTVMWNNKKKQENRYLTALLLLIP